MAFQSDRSRTWDEERGLELVVTIWRVATEYRIKKGEDVLVNIDAWSCGRDLTDDEKKENPGFDKEVTWHIFSYWANDPLLTRLGFDAEQLISEALITYRGGLAGFKDQKPIYALVRVRFGSPLRRPEIY
jgi:hypothetical protein